MAGFVETEDVKRTQTIQLLSAIKNKKEEEAIMLIREGVEPDYKDETGSSLLHYAAADGLNSVVEELLKAKAEVTLVDKNGLSPLHKAALNGHVQSIVILMAWGGNLHMGDNNEMNALDYAVNYGHEAVVDMLCQPGVEPYFADWSWGKRTDRRKMLEIIKKQLDIYPGIQQGHIGIDIKRITRGTNQNVHLERTNVDIIVPEDQGDYYLYLCRKPEEYSDRPALERGEIVFGHLLECQTWGSKVESITLQVPVDVELRKHKEVVLRSPSKGTVVNVGDKDVGGVKITTITISVPLSLTGVTHITMASRTKTEKFQISSDEITIKPASEPGAEIEISAGTFKPCELSVRFVDTKGIIEGGVPGEERSKLVTNILDISTSDDQQPRKDIEVKLPIIANDDVPEHIIAILVSNPDPTLKIWKGEVIQARKDHGKAVFQMRHFSICTLTSMTSLDSVDNNTEINEMRQAYTEERKVNFLVAIKADGNQIRVEIACGPPKILKKKYDAYEVFYLKSNLSYPNGQRFWINFDAYEAEPSKSENNLLILKDTVSQRTLGNFKIPGSLQKLSGNVHIFTYQEPKREEVVDASTRVEVVDVSTCICSYSSKRHMKVSPHVPIRTNVGTIPFTVNMTARGKHCMIRWL
ncbi:uncharacterized protein [Argopecten irradians]|uniref:uncharacterized protein n=1 Tax=Argopecten irradians TaxID=31199 RepID=UPI00371CE55B